MTQTFTTVGLIGIGHIGLPLSVNLLGSGLKVIGYGKDNLDAFAKAGGTVAASAADVAARTDVILHSLPTEDALEDVVHGPAGILKTLRPGTTVIELSTYSLEAKQRLAKTLSDAGAALLDCEMSGTPPMVAAKKNLILVSGERALAERMQPLLLRGAAKAPYIGPLGTSLKLKLVNNMLGAVHVMAAAEAIHLAGKAGIDPQAALEALGGGASSSVHLLQRGPRMVSHDYAASEGPLGLFWKYLELGPILAKEANAPTPMFDTALRYFKQALDAGRGGEDISVVFDMLRQERP